ncbi:hypothetical protein L7F22_061660 [Adiantum nelumboides]|nr:hypothetical protein [Adiantum nelumboides]
MAARKLAAEIDKTLKRIAEGVQEFESIYEKLQSASTPSQTTKYESELKTSIKRLQRHRDSLKTWLQSNDIKDKSALMENRRLIETQMERFKACEKEMKTKAFSKEGLIAAARLDPAEKAKVELSQWISQQVDELSRQVEASEAELEQLAGGGKKKKGGAGAAAVERVAQLEHLNERRNWHSSRLEILLRMLENGSLETEQVERAKEDISYFVETNAEEDFEEDDGIYDEYNLDDEEEAFGLKDNDDAISHDATSLPDETPKAPSKDSSSTKQRRESEDAGRPEEKPSSVSAAASSSPSTVAAKKGPTTAAAKKEATAKDNKAVPPANFSQAKAPSSQPSVTSPQPPKAPSAGAAALPPIRYAAAAAAAVSPTQAMAPAAPTVASPGPSNAQSSSDAQGSKADEASTLSAATSQSPAPSHPQHSQQSAPSASNPGSLTSTPATESARAASLSANHDVADTSLSGASALGGQPLSPASAHQVNTAGPPGLGKHVTQQQQVNGHQEEADEHRQDQSQFEPAQLAASSAAAGVVQPAGGGAGTQREQQAAQRLQGTDARLPSSLADLVSSFESAKQNSMRRDNDLSEVHKSLESSFMNVPDAQDSDRPRYYVPQNPCPTPAWYPQSPAAIFDNPAIYARFDEDTLFYIFYYSQRDYHRYLAARELKRQSWRFSMRYGTWFRRHSEPITINEDYEEGSYIYFDFESTWSQRRKNLFRFEYKYLESEL